MGLRLAIDYTQLKYRLSLLYQYPWPILKCTFYLTEVDVTFSF